MICYPACIICLDIFMLCGKINRVDIEAKKVVKLPVYRNVKIAPYLPKNCDQLLTNKSPVKQNNWYNSTTSRMLIYQQPLHIYKAQKPPSSGNKSLSAAGGRYSEMIYCAAVDKIEEMRKPDDFIGHRKRDCSADTESRC